MVSMDKVSNEDYDMATWVAAPNNTVKWPSNGCVASPNYGRYQPCREDISVGYLCAYHHDMAVVNKNKAIHDSYLADLRRKEKQAQSSGEIHPIVKELLGLED